MTLEIDHQYRCFAYKKRVEGNNLARAVVKTPDPHPISKQINGLQWKTADNEIRKY